MKKDIFTFILFLNIFILISICFEIIKIRWEFTQEYENYAYLKVANNKLAEINLHLKTENYHLSSPAKVERHAKDILQMVEITEVTNINYEK